MSLMEHIETLDHHVRLGGIHYLWYGAGVQYVKSFSMGEGAEMFFTYLNPGAGWVNALQYICELFSLLTPLLPPPHPQYKQ